MQNKQPYPSGQSPRPRPRPVMDIIPHKKKPKAHVPEVGMTLRAYTQQPPKAIKRTLPPPPPRVDLADMPVAARVTPKKRGRSKRILHGITIKRTILVLLLLILSVGGYVGYKFVYNTHKIFGGSILGVLDTTKLKGESTGRVNILLAGNSADDPGHDGADLTDSILIMSVDPQNNTAFLLSVPRDLWVEIPGYDHQKINDAYVVGQNNSFSANGYPNGGMGQLEQVISQDFGIPIDYYALIDYNALKEAVNAVGGISVTIQSDDPRGLYDPSIDYATHGPLVKLTDGVHVLTGEQALDLARARGDAYGSYGFPESDFDRTQNQRLMLVALKSKVVSAGVLSNPAKLSSLADALGNNVTTDMKLSEVRRLYDIVKPISSSNIASLSLNDADGKNLLANYNASDSEGDIIETLIPAAGIDDYNDIQAYITQQTSSNPLVREDASIVVLNATTTSGLASTAKSTMTQQGLNVASIGDATADQPTTTIIDNSAGKMPATLKKLQQLFGNNVTTANPYSGVYTANFIVVLGQDRVQTTSTTSGSTSAN